MPPVPLIELGFPLGIRLTHAFNLVFLTLLVRSGIEILGGHPMLYFNDHCRPGSEWIRFTSKRMFRNQRWTAEDEKQPYTPWVALPGRDNLGLGRFWHFVAVVGWLVTGMIYLLVLATSEQWQRLVPTSWAVLPQAWEAAMAYLRLDIPRARQSVQRAPAVDLLRARLRPHAVADLDGSGDVTRARRPFPLVSTPVRRTAGRPQPALSRTDGLRGVHGSSHRAGHRAWLA